MNRLSVAIDHDGQQNNHHDRNRDEIVEGGHTDGSHSQKDNENLFGCIRRTRDRIAGKNWKRNALF